MTDSTIQILLVEDDDTDAQFVNRALAQPTSALKFELTHVRSVRAACAAVSDKRFDLVLLDLGLPDGVGMQNLETILAAEPSCRVIVLSGWDEAFHQRLRRLGAAACIEKNACTGKQLRDLVASTVSSDLEASIENASSPQDVSDIESALEHLSELERSLLSTEQQESIDSVRYLLRRFLDASTH